MPKINNPNGKKGGDKHQEYVEKLANEVSNIVDDKYGQLTSETEYPVTTPQGKKRLRFLDVAGYVNTTNEKGKKKQVLLKAIQVGLSDENENPIKREQEAIDDIEEEIDIKVEFYDYLKNKKIR